LPAVAGAGFGTMPTCFLRFFFGMLVSHGHGIDLLVVERRENGVEVHDHHPFCSPSPAALQIASVDSSIESAVNCPRLCRS